MRKLGIKPHEWELKNVMITAFEEGVARGKKEENAKAFKRLGVAIKIIVAATGLTTEEVERL
ncbi:MAG: hypothetical protein GQ569_00630 [Methylococcaceae bacterium]|nr:hypothetical protein [Methylococcaceae bacterium]